MMSPTCSELQASRNVFNNVPPDLVVSTQGNSRMPSEKNRSTNISAERRRSSRPSKHKKGHQIAEILDQKSLSEGEKVPQLQKSDLVPGHWQRNDKRDVVDKQHSLVKADQRVEKARNESGDMRYGLIACPYQEAEETVSSPSSLSHVEKWVREQEFLLYKPKDIEPFSSDLTYETEQLSTHRKDSAHSSSLDGSGSIPRKFIRPGYKQPAYETQNPLEMRPPPLRNGLPPSDYRQLSKKLDHNYEIGNIYAGSSPSRATPPNYEDSIRARMGSSALKTTPPRSDNSRPSSGQKLRNGYKELNSNVVLPNYPSFIRVRTVPDRGDSSILDGQHIPLRRLHRPGQRYEVEEFVTARNLPDVAKEATESTGCLVRNDFNELAHTASNASDNKVVLRRKLKEEHGQTNDDRQFKAQSWPKFTVTSVVVPTAKKVKVTPVGSLSSVIVADDMAEAEENTERQEKEMDGNGWTQEEKAFLKQYILADGGSESSSKQDSKSKDYQNTEEEESGQTSSPAVSNLPVVPSNSNVAEIDGPLSNFSSSLRGIDSNKEIEIAGSGLLSQRTEPMQSLLPASNGEVVYKTETSLEPGSGEFRQSAGYKRASGGLKDLIRLHEQEIARVAKKEVVRKPSLPLKTRKDSLGHRHTSLGIGLREKSDVESSNADSRWKRHTTIGLVNVDEPYSGHQILQELSAGRPASSNAFLSTDLGLDSISVRKVFTAYSLPDEKTPPPLPPKPKFFTDPSTARRPKSLNEVYDDGPRVRSRSRRSEEEARYELEKVTRALESFKTLSIERTEEGCQTEGKVYLEAEVRTMTADLRTSVANQKAEMDRQIVERMELERKLNEQRKVANAYQKLEDRYRRKVHDLQNLLMSCTCGTGFVVNNSKNHRNINNTFPRHGKKLTLPPSEPEEKTAAKVDGILQELESWLNTQQTSRTSSSEELSAINHQAKSLENLRAGLLDGWKARDNPHFEILDEIDATCV